MNDDQRTTLAVAGMTCDGCVRHVKSALEALPSVSDVDVRLAEGRVTLRHDPGVTTSAQLVAALDEDGYPARVETE